MGTGDAMGPLTDWIDDRHLRPETMARYHARFTSDAFTSLVLDDFLHASRLSLLQRCFDEDAAFARNYGVIERSPGVATSWAERAVDEASFRDSPGDSQLACESVITGHAEGREFSAGWTANLDFIDLLESAEFAAYLTAITGIGQLNAMTFLPRVMERSDFCRAHDDMGGTRRLCMLFYVDDGWRPGFGGRFQHLSDGQVARSVEPVGNRVLLHQPRSDQIHQVEAFAGDAVDWRRCTYSIWFSSEPEGLT